MFDDLSENAGISDEIKWVFFHRFIDLDSMPFCTRSMSLLRNLPMTLLLTPRNTKSWTTLPGCVGSMDAVEIEVRGFNEPSCISFRYVRRESNRL
jgi:hypothetical protein